MLNVFTYVGFACLVQVTHLLLRKPHRILFELNLDVSLSVLTLIDNDIAIFVHNMLFVWCTNLAKSIENKELLDKKKTPQCDVFTGGYFSISFIFLTSEANSSGL